MECSSPIHWHCEGGGGQECEQKCGQECEQKCGQECEQKCGQECEQKCERGCEQKCEWGCGQKRRDDGGSQGDKAGQAGSKKEALETLFLMEKEYLYKIAFLYMKNKEDVLDLVQESIL